MYKNILLLGILIGILSSGSGQPVPENIASKAALSMLISENQVNNFNIQSSFPLRNSENAVQVYVYSLEPQGFIIVSGRYELPPVIAYSFTDNMDKENRLINLVRKDIGNRIDNLPLSPESIVKQNLTSWNSLLINPGKSPSFQQWPPAGTTSTGGWLETKWHQDAPYNDKCPMDPVTGLRSLAGCPAVAMAQIVNYHQTTNNVVFSDADDYQHNYQGRVYMIDDDADSLDFPSFPDLNLYLSDISTKYQTSTPLVDADKATLVFASAVAATQVFTSAGSGTFSVSQARDAYLKFNFNSIELLDAGDTNLYSRMAQNMKDSLPVHLAIVNAAWTSGHNVVVDGYNTDDYFHLNFGWGGPSNSWYLLPSQIPYSLTVIEGAIVDIIPNPVTSLAKEAEGKATVFPNPACCTINFSLPIPGSYHIELYTIDGQCVRNAEGNGKTGQFDISPLPAGIYLLTIQTNHSVLQKKIIKQNSW